METNALMGEYHLSYPYEAFDNQNFYPVCYYDDFETCKVGPYWWTIVSEEHGGTASFDKRHVEWEADF